MAAFCEEPRNNDIALCVTSNYNILQTSRGGPSACLQLIPFVKIYLWHHHSSGFNCMYLTHSGLEASSKVCHTLRWRHNGCDCVSNHLPHDCLLNRLFRRRSKETSKLRVTGLCAKNSPVTGEFPAQWASNAENVSIWWRHHELILAMAPSHYLNQLESYKQDPNIHLFRKCIKMSSTNVANIV